jgi:hypothetical protein
MQSYIKLQNPLKTSPNSLVCPADSLALSANEQLSGIFWIAYKDFLSSFEVVTSSRLHPNYFYSFLPPFNSSKILPSPCSYSLYLLRVVDKTHCYISLNQRNERFYEKKNSYFLMRMMLISLNKNKVVIFF